MVAYVCMVCRVFISASIRISLILGLGTFGPHPEDPTWTTYQINLWSMCVSSFPFHSPLLR